MAGTLFGLALSQPIDLNGKPQVGCKLYIYQAGSFTNAVTAYKDFGLTAGQEHPFPIPSNAWGRLPIFWLADGSYAFRLVDADGTVIESSLNVQALGPSSGAGGGGGSVDPNAIFKTGDVIWLDVSGIRAGWVRDNGRTIGSATSGATERANSDCLPLYEYLWATYSDAICPVTGGRGASAAADFSANKPIQLPDKRGRLPAGLDDMGNVAASRFSNVPFSQGNATTAGSIGGEALHTLSVAELASHNHDITDPGHAHVEQMAVTSGDVTDTLRDTTNMDIRNPLHIVSANINTQSSVTGITVNAKGSGTAHNNMPPFVLGTFYRKL